MTQPQLNGKPQKKITDEGIAAFNKQVETEMFTIPVDKLPADFNVKDSFLRAMNCFSPLSLRVPDTWYVKVMESKFTEFSYSDMQVLKQILPQATGRAMNMQPKQYITFLKALAIITFEFSEVWNGLIKQYEENYPEPVVEDVPKERETTIIDISKAVQAAQSED